MTGGVVRVARGIATVLVYLLMAAIVVAPLHVGWDVTAGALDEIRTGWASTQWPAASGVIDASFITQEQGRRRLVDVPHVHYHYLAGGRLMRSDAVRADPAIQDGDVPGLLNAYPKGARVTVYYDPASGTSVLEPGVSFWSWLGLVVGTFIFLFGVAASCWYLKTLNEQRNRYVERRRIGLASSSDARLAQEVARRRAELSRRPRP